MPLCSMNSEIEPRAASSRGVSVLMRFPSNGSWALLSCKAKGNSSWRKEMID